MRDLTREEVAAMWLFGADYARAGVSAVGWWAHLDAGRRRVVHDFLGELDRASNAPAPTHGDGDTDNG